MTDIQIISKTPLFEHITWPVTLMFVLTVISLCIIAIQYIRSHKFYQSIGTMLITAGTGVFLIIISAIYVSLFCHRETDRFRYTAVFPEDITLQEFTDFSENYTNIYQSNDVWYFEDKE